MNDILFRPLISCSVRFSTPSHPSFFSTRNACTLRLPLPHPLHVKLKPVPLVAEFPDGIVVGSPAHVVALLVGIAAAEGAAGRAAVDGGGITATVGGKGEVSAVATGSGAHKVEVAGNAGVAINKENAEGGEVAESLGDGTGKLVAVEHKDDEVVEIAKTIGDGTGKLILVEIEEVEAG
mmetsp:Transcript_1729/g.3813  ORF Transcript_1729/g.3813 Transcript_1729/m.3813 type:complete len:179 (-) Transcript_1729:1745-2281(-)